jgi:anhydro-N-acetylmuramic acid kinase
MAAKNKISGNDFSDRKILTAIGMMSGTSMDGIDVALMRTDGVGDVDVLFAAEYAYEAAFRAKLDLALAEAKTLASPDERNAFLKAVETEITDRHAAAVKRLLKTCNLPPERIDLIGFHGQTVLHRPDLGFTVQLGDGRRLADATGIAVVADMRSNDMAHGGQGAPLVPAYHQALAGHLTKLPKAMQGLVPVAFVNIGGIANITWIGSDGELIAFDTGPGNALIDQWVQAVGGIPYDQGGMIAAEGGIVQEIVDGYLAESFFEKAAPKSLDRNDFAPLKPGSASLEEGARTLARVSAEAILQACDHLPEPPKLWIVSGGGRKNPAIMGDLKALAAERHSAEVITAEEAGFDGDAMEAEAWAFLAVRSVKNLPLTFPMTTACHLPVSGGKLFLP